MIKVNQRNILISEELVNEEKYTYYCTHDTKFGSYQILQYIESPTSLVALGKIGRPERDPKQI